MHEYNNFKMDIFYQNYFKRSNYFLVSSVLPSQTRDKRISSSSTLPPVEQSGESLLMPSLANLKSTSKTKPLPKIKQSMNQHEDELAEEKYQMEKVMTIFFINFLL